MLGPILMEHTDRPGEYRSQIPFMPAVQQPTPEQIDDFCKLVTNDVNALCSALGDIKTVEKYLEEAVVCGAAGLVGKGACDAAALVCKVFKALGKIGSITGIYGPEDVARPYCRSDIGEAFALYYANAFTVTYSGYVYGLGEDVTPFSVDAVRQVQGGLTSPLTTWQEIQQSGETYSLFYVMTPRSP